MGTALDYTCDGSELRGYLARSSAPSPAPGVFIVHTWLGLTDSIRDRARRLADAGFTVLALDIFGPNVTHAPPEIPHRVVEPYVTDRALFLKRMRAGISALRAQPEVDALRIGGVGYCFGGSGILELARDGERFEAGVALHAILKTRTPMQSKRVHPKLLVLQGDADPLAPPADVNAFLAELRAAEANWELTLYGGARHSFTGEGAWGEALPEARLDRFAEDASWRATVDFLRRTLT